MTFLLYYLPAIILLYLLLNEKYNTTIINHFCCLVKQNFGQDYNTDYVKPVLFVATITPLFNIILLIHLLIVYRNNQL